MAITNVSLSDTFDVWRTRFNQVVDISNVLTEGQANIYGTLTVSNPNYLKGNTTISVTNGSISIATGNLNVKGNVFSSNGITFTSNSPTLAISGSGLLGGQIFFSIGTLSSSIADANTGNIASANSVNSVNQLLTALYGKVNTVYTAGNSSWTQANAAYTQANVVFAQANVAYDRANTGVYIANLAFDKANTSGGYWRGNNGDKGLVAAKGDLFRINANTLTSNIGFDNGENAQTVGPIVLADNANLYVNTGARVVIV